MSKGMSSDQNSDLTKAVVGIALAGLAAVGINHVTDGRAGQAADKITDALNPGETVAVPAKQVAQARAGLPKLPVRPLDKTKSYDRAAFGPAWVDTAIPGVVAANRCDTRSDILRRDLTGLVPPNDPTAKKPPCAVVSGVLHDPYTGKTITYHAGPKAAQVQIDHVVALGEAWEQGASDWTPSKRRQLANDPRNLRAVDGPSNIKKSDSTADKWSPRAGDWCQFGTTIVIVKTVYGLSVTADEHDTLGRMLARCP